MTYKSLREEAFSANLEIPKHNLAIYTWGNVSAFDAGAGIFAIKPSGVSYDKLTAADIVLVDLDGRVIDSSLRPSSDTETHRILYREFAGIRGITHTHSTFATAFSQARIPVPIYGTTHADHASHTVPCTEYLTESAVNGGYERETGILIADTFKKLRLEPLDTPMVLVAGHGPFTWGESAAKSVYNAAILEEVCKMAAFTRILSPNAAPLPAHIIRKHWERKHGPDAYYGQK